MPDLAEAVDLQANSQKEHADTPKDRVRKAKASRQKPSLPKPKALRVSPEQLEKWLRSFNSQQEGRAVIHVYRDWPAINRKLIGEQKEKLIQRWDGVLPFAQTDETPDLKTFILHNAEWGGSGKYKIMVTEIGVAGCISMTSFTLEDSEFPPRVDPATLIVGHPENKGYIEGLRASGIAIPGDDPEAYRAKQEKEREMDIATAAFEQLAKQNEKLQERIEDLTERQDEVEETDPAEEAVESVASQVLGAGLRMVEKQVDRVTQQSAVSYNPIEVAKSVMEMSREMKGDSAGIVSVIQSMAAQQTQFLQAMLEEQRKETAYWRDRATQAVVPVEPQKGVIEQFKDLAEFKSISRELFGREPRAEREPEAPRKGWLDTLLENPQLPQLANGLFAMLGQLAIAFRGGSLPPGSPDALRSALNGANGTALTNGNAEHSPAPDPQEQARQATRAFLQRIEKPFIAHFFDTELQDLNGYTFAQRMHCEFVPDGPVTNAGRAEYLTIRDRWGQQFDQLLRNYQPIWNMVQGNVPKYQQFLKEFFSYDQWANDQQEPAKPVAVS
jgi:hypothetical protein